MPKKKRNYSSKKKNRKLNSKKKYTDKEKSLYYSDRYHSHANLPWYKRLFAAFRYNQLMRKHGLHEEVIKDETRYAVVNLDNPRNDGKTKMFKSSKAAINYAKKNKLSILRGRWNAQEDDVRPNVIEKNPYRDFSK